MYFNITQVWPEPPKVDGDKAAIKMPPAMMFGKNSANRMRSKIEELAIERGVEVKPKGQRDSLTSAQSKSTDAKK